MANNSRNDKKHLRIAVMVLVLIILVGGAFLLGTQLSKNDNSKPGKTTSTSIDERPSTRGDLKHVDIRSIVSYNLPRGAKETFCPGSRNIVNIVPSDFTEPNCNDPQATSNIAISLLPPTITDCNQLQGEQTNIIKHTCTSLYIDGHKSLKSITVYAKESAGKAETHVKSYYINTGKYVVQVMYVDKNSINSNDLQTAFDMLALSVKIK